MKLTFIMIMGFTLASFAEGRAQTERINFKIDRIPAEMVIQQLKELTHYRFLYNHEEIKQLPTKQIELKEATIEEVLQVFLAGSKLNYTIEDDVIIISPKLKKQPSQQVKAIRITGKVRDEQKQSLHIHTLYPEQYRSKLYTCILVRRDADTRNCLHG